MRAIERSAPSSKIDIPGELSESGLELEPGLPFHDWAEVGKSLARIERASRWWIGDWLAYGDDAFAENWGERYTEALAATGLDYTTVAHYKLVSSRIDFCTRVQKLSWSHHREVAPLDPAEQKEWLAKAEQNGWTCQQLRQWLKRGKKAKPLPTNTPLLRFCQDLPTPLIVSQILRVFFPDARTALDSTYGLGGFWDGSESIEVTGLDNDAGRHMDGEVDFRDMPYDNEAFDVVLFDPPHLADGGSESIMVERFKTYSDAELPDVIRDGTAEAWRVAKLGIVVKICEHVHGQKYVPEARWVEDAVPAPVYDKVHQVRTGAMIDPKWEEQLSAYNNGSTYLIFRKDGPLHVRRLG